MTSADELVEPTARDGVRVLAIAESDAYLKWAAWTLDALPVGWTSSLVLVRSPITPSVSQVDSALDGTRRAGQPMRVMKARALRREVRRARPDVVFLACTGPTVAALCMAMILLRRRPLIVSALPGVGLPVRRRAVVARSWTDVFVAHSHRERREYATMFSAMDASIRVGLAHLPFLSEPVMSRGGDPEGPVVFAAQPSVPAARYEREQLLRSLTELGPPAPIVKIRGRPGESTTHDEPWPYAHIWTELVESAQVDGAQLEFVGGALAPVLDRARCLVTVSSTAAIEAMAVGVPVVAVDEFGVDAGLLNDLFLGSGVLGPVTVDRIAAAGLPATEWARDNYFHDRDDDDWIETIGAALEHRHRQRRRWRLRFLIAGARRSVRLATSRPRVS